jgi:hypothetical protein
LFIELTFYIIYLREFMTLNLFENGKQKTQSAQSCIGREGQNQ